MCPFATGSPELPAGTLNKYLRINLLRDNKPHPQSLSDSLFCLEVSGPKAGGQILPGEGGACSAGPV